MDVNGRGCSSEATQSEEEMDLRRGPWTVDEDLTLINYIANHGEGHWNSLARCAGIASSTTIATHHIGTNPDDISTGHLMPTASNNDYGGVNFNPSFTPENSSTAVSSDSLGTQVSPVSDLTDYYSFQANNSTDNFQADQVSCPDSLTSPSGYFNHGLDFQAIEQNMWLGGGDVPVNLWNDEDLWF
ncbi:hypothetical protein HHK36_026265 [Tetracentron sinense]|uniref:Uncharacterized protein n=1 Tax=Tetracentron sinense TaxID=13715 RepID=A0A834YF26_TETSI|nr:hypothetical protein HHK36_026265 [Tetracentron sinense]